MTKVTKMKQVKKSRRYELLQDIELRQEFLAEQIKVGLRFQLRSLRDSQDLTQGKLAELIGTKQSVISRLEKYPERLSLPTLIDIANALDVGVVVRFEQIDSIIEWYDNPTVTKMTPKTSEQVLNAPEAVGVVTTETASERRNAPKLPILTKAEISSWFEVLDEVDVRDDSSSPYTPVPNLVYRDGGNWLH